MPTPRKAAVIDDLTEKLGRINAAALIEYRGLSVTEFGDLRTQLRQQGVELQVTKNTLLREAAHRNNMNDLDDLFTGPTAVAFIYGEEAAGTKALTTYFRTARVGEIKSGLLKGGRSLTAEEFAKLADLPNRETLLAQIAGLLESPLSQLASLFNAPAQQLAYAIAALEDKGGAPGAGITATTGAPAPASGTDTGVGADAAPGADAADAPVTTTVAEPVAEPPTDVAETAGPVVEATAPTDEAGVTPLVEPAQEAADPTSAPASEGTADAQP